jgi:YHS domain-containing protein
MHFFQCIGAMSLCFVTAVHAESNNVDVSGVMLQGYDVVSYFEGAPISGDVDYSTEYNGATYHFSSQQHLEQFNLSPVTYAPQYGGYCSYGVRLGKKFDIDVAAYEIVNNKLYLMLDRPTQVLWNKDRAENIKVAEEVWPKIANTPANELD